MSLYPVNLKIEKRLCLVIGGGAVALRKIRGLVGGGAQVRVVSPLLLPELKDLIVEKDIEWVARGYVEGDLKGAFLVFAATDDQKVQTIIKEEAVRYGVLLNSADDPKGCHFHVPAHFRRGKMLVTVSTEGGSPALSRKIRKKLEAEIAPGYAKVVDLLFLVRQEVVGEDGDSAVHRELFCSLLDGGVVELILSENWFELQMLLLQELPGQIDGVALLKKFLNISEEKDHSPADSLN